ncbi:hypothetical protein [Bacillus pinisoli]|uniref:hypothetical protein n=1 Tax=Bacillus pinisoli TaxID=2901866 RepID=UPI001FF37EE6|nr:hypothetical protein [Bacillus pinisoli]
MKYFILYIFIISLVACSNGNDTDISLLPREYYRPLLTEKEIGVAFSKNKESLDDLIPQIIQHEKISEAIYVTHEGETVIGLRLMPYHRKASHEVIKEIATLSMIEETNIIDDPRKYRIMEKLNQDKKIYGITTSWIDEWMSLKE